MATTTAPLPAPPTAAITTPTAKLMPTSLLLCLAVGKGRPRRRLLAAAIAATASLAAPCIAAAETVSFLPIGAEQTFVVPADVTSIHAIAIGGRGGNGTGNVGGRGGFGAVAGADLAVTPGQTLYIEVGGNGADAGAGGAGGFNGGGASGSKGSASAGGGGASDIRLAPLEAGTSLGLRMIVAAGGGGAGSGVEGGTPSHTLDGGSAGPSPTAGTPSGGGGQPGSATAGGAGGAGCAIGADQAKAGTLALGGQGSDANCQGSPVAGGGGGGGIYGGGGGGASSQGAGGGAGSSGVGPGAGNGTIATDSTGKPSITLSFTPMSTSATNPPPVISLAPPAALPTVNPANCRVPDLSGRKLKGARKVARNRGCKVGKVHHADRGSRKVIAQSPKPGAIVPAGTKIGVTIGRGGKAHRRRPAVRG